MMNCIFLSLLLFGVVDADAKKDEAPSAKSDSKDSKDRWTNGLWTIRDLGNDSPTTLCRWPQTRQEIKLTQKQWDELQRLAAERQKAVLNLAVQAEENNESPNLDPQAARRTNLELFQTIRRMENQDASRILTPSQIRRLNQIHLQIQGPLALADPEFQAYFNLSPEQRETILSIREHCFQVQTEITRSELAMEWEFHKTKNNREPIPKAEMDSFYRGKSDVFDANLKRKLSAREAGEREVLRQLTKRQRELFAKALGEPFKLGEMAEPGAPPSTKKPELTRPKVSNPDREAKDTEIAPSVTPEKDDANKPASPIPKLSPN